MNPDDILSQIQQLCQAFVQSGGDPGMVMDTVAQTVQGYDQQGADPSQDPAAAMAGGGMPPSDGSDPMAALMAGGDQGEAVPDDMSDMAPEGGMPAGTSLAQAAQMAMEDMKKRKTKGQ